MVLNVSIHMDGHIHKAGRMIRARVRFRVRVTVLQTELGTRVSVRVSSGELNVFLKSRHLAVCTAGRRTQLAV